MKNIGKPIVFSAILAAAPGAKAAQMDFDGISGGTAAFAEDLHSSHIPEVAALVKNAAEPPARC